MADRAGDEKLFLGSFVKTQTKYGTTSKPVTKHKNFVKHNIVKSDTLIGIALKYGVTVEALKRHNNMWTNDSLFLRESLQIPIPEKNSQQTQNSSNSSWQNFHEYNGYDNCDIKGATSLCAKTSPEPVSSSQDDFWSKYDDSMQKIKSNLNKMNENIKVRHLDDYLPYTLPDHR